MKRQPFVNGSEPFINERKLLENERKPLQMKRQPFVNGSEPFVNERGPLRMNKNTLNGLLNLVFFTTFFNKQVIFVNTSVMVAIKKPFI